MTNIKQNTAAFIVCPNCHAPTFVPKHVEYEIESYESFNCYECKETINLSGEFKCFVQATRRRGGNYL